MTPYLQYLQRLKLGQVKPPEKKKPAKIRQYSKKRAKINREYGEITKPLWKGQDCQARTPDCTGKGQGMHHLEGKETTEKLLNTDKMIVCCNACNGWIERNDAEARKLGLKLSRLNKK